MQRLGILGGGQLARMTVQAAIPLGIDIAILADAPDSPAGRVTGQEIVGAWNDEAVLREFADRVDVVTLENEFVDAEVLDRLAFWGKRVLPGAHTLRLIGDKLIQKQTLADRDLPVAPFAPVDRPEDVMSSAERWGWPLVIKARRNGYDGYGNATIAQPSDIDAALDRLGFPDRGLLVEQAVPFVRELAVLVARRTNGETAVYPVVETVQRNHICHVVRAPAAVDRSIAAAVTEIAVAAVEAVGGVGITAVEMFLLADGTVLVNELAPRPHNSGHYSIDASYTSQFENHLRAVLDLPLGDPALRVPAAVMVNLLGTRDGPSIASGLDQALQSSQMRVHLYGKRESRRGRKLGHVTALGSSLTEAEALARHAADGLTL